MRPRRAGSSALAQVYHIWGPHAAALYSSCAHVVHYAAGTWQFSRQLGVESAQADFVAAGRPGANSFAGLLATSV